VLELPPGLVELTVSADGYTDTALRNMRVVEAKTVSELEVELDRNASITGRVTDAEGKPLGGTLVQLFRDEQIVWRPDPTLTNDRGEYAVKDVAAGEYTVAFWKAGYFKKRKPAEALIGKETPLDAELEAGLELRGQIIDADRQPVSGATVSLSGPCCNTTAQSSADGSFVLTGLENGRYAVRAEKKGYIDDTTSDIEVPAKPLAIRLERGGTITGTIRGVSPEDRAKLTVEAQKGGMRERGEIDPATGSFRIDSVSDGVASVIAMVGQDYKRVVSKDVEVRNGTGGPVELDFEGGFTITGMVTRNGVPVEGTVYFHTKSSPRFFSQSFSTHNGRYEAKRIGEGECMVIFQLPSNGNYIFRETTVFTGDATYDIELRGATVRGRVTDKTTGLPLAAAKVSVDGTYRDTQLSDRGGTYTIDFVPDGWFRVTAHLAHYAAAEGVVEVAAQRAPAVDLQMIPVDATILRIIDAADGHPVQATVGVSDEARRGVFYDRATTGVLQLWLLPGQYTASVKEADYVEQRDIPVNVPGPEIVIALERKKP
jgi:hypothetical protein